MAEEQQRRGAFRTSIGGQALIEGILMRGPEKQAIVVRDKDGKLVEKVEELRFIKDRYPILGLPLVRGTVNFLAAMVSGVKALMYSADFYPDEEAAQPSKFEQWMEKHLSSEKLERPLWPLRCWWASECRYFCFWCCLRCLPAHCCTISRAFPCGGGTCWKVC